MKRGYTLRSITLSESLLSYIISAVFRYKQGDTTVPIKNVAVDSVDFRSKEHSRTCQFFWINQRPAESWRR